MTTMAGYSGAGFMALLRLGALLSVSLVLAGCVTTGQPVPAPAPPPAPAAAGADGGRLSPQDAARNFVTVVERVEPVAERFCRQQAGPGQNCDLQIVVDRRRNLPPNAFQTIDEQGRPVVGFTLALIADARNEDEIAFVLGHEASHHILGHIGRKQQGAEAGAVLGTMLGQATGADAATMKQWQSFGASIGARRYSKEYELEADALGARIAWYAGYDPVRGAGFFSRLPDPGDQFLGSHPPNAQRLQQVGAVVAGLERQAAY
jgi:predicted Zn-dependent protease